LPQTGNRRGWEIRDLAEPDRSRGVQKAEKCSGLDKEGPLPGARHRTVAPASRRGQFGFQVMHPPGLELWLNGLGQRQGALVTGAGLGGTMQSGQRVS